MSLSLCLSVCLFFCLFVCFSVCLSVCLSLSISISLSLYLSISLSLPPPPPFLSLSLSLSLSLFLSLSHSLTHSHILLCTPFFLSIIPPASCTFPLSLSPSLPPHRPPVFTHHGAGGATLVRASGRYRARNSTTNTLNRSGRRVSRAKKSAEHSPRPSWAMFNR